MNTYTTISGDAWDVISRRVYGDEAFTGALMEANGEHASTVIFSVGVELVIPPVPPPSPADNLPPWIRNAANG
jgi:phage tail protein X